MSTLLGFIKALIPQFPTRQERDEAYLAESVSVCDLERCIRDVDGGQRSSAVMRVDGLHWS